MDQLPENMLQRLSDDMFEAMAYLKTKGDPRVMASFVSPPSLLVLLGLTLLMVLIAAGLAAMSNYQNVRANWSEYRCDPSVTPFAKFYGFSLEDTVNFCIGQSVKEHAPGVINPIYDGINKITGVVDGVYTKVEAVEGGVSGLLSGFNTFLVNFENSFRLLGTRVRMSFIRIKDIFARVYGVFIAFSYAAISAITFGENLICNPLVTFVAGFAGVDICCFAPDTQILMEDGSTRTISDIKIGDQLMGSTEVVSTYLFDGVGTRMYKIHGIHVSGNHYVAKDDGAMVRVDEHPAAVPAPELERLWCLGTSSNLIPIQTPGGRTLIFADYEESSDPEVIAAAQRIAEQTLGQEPGPTVADYSLGLDSRLSVQMADGTWTPLPYVKIGDITRTGGRVVGLVQEICDDVRRSPSGCLVSAAQLVWVGGKWVRAAHVWSPYCTEEMVFYHLMIDNDEPIAVGANGFEFLVRDYAEITNRDIQGPYDAALKK